MRWPVNPANNPKNVRNMQTIMVPHVGRKFVFTRTPSGSYTDVNEVYTCSGYPNTGDRYGSHDIYCTRVKADGTSCGTYDRLTAWGHAEWRYVDED